MEFLIGVLYGGAALVAGLMWRARLRWRRIVARPVVTCVQIADIDPGAAVVVAGRTAAGPSLVAPLSRASCVWYKTVRTRTQKISDNYEETTQYVVAESGDPKLYDDGGSSVYIDPTLGRRFLHLAWRTMIGQVVSDRDGGRGDLPNSYDTLDEYIIPVDTAVVVTGVVELAGGQAGVRLLDKGSWVDGCVQGQLDELPGRHARSQLWRLASMLLLAVVAVVLTLVVAA